MLEEGILFDKTCLNCNMKKTENFKLKIKEENYGDCKNARINTL